MKYLRTLRMGLIPALLGTALLAAQEQNPKAKKAAPKGPPQKPASTTPPDMTNVVYGSDEKFNVIDLWKAKSDKPTPLVIFIHGGGFGGGSKDYILSKLSLDEYLKAGVSCASIDYRRLQSKPGPRQFIYPAIFLDCARAVQFLRYKAKEWNLDPKRFACAGGSAGAGMALWIGFHKDLADPKSDDPVARESTRLTCIAVFDAQTSYDARWIKKNLLGKAFMVPNIHQLFGMEPSEMLKPVPDYTQFNKQPVSELLTPSPEKAKLMEDGSPINHVTAEAPPVYVYYKGQRLNPPKSSDDIHQIQFGLRLKEKMDDLKVECEIAAGWPKNPQSTGPDKTDVEFVLRHFGMKQSESSQKGEPQKGEPQKGPKQTLPEPTKKIVYKKFGDKELLLHVFEPAGHKATDQRPAIVLFHGGGWSIGDPSHLYPQCAYLAQRGMWAASGQYRLKPKDATRIGDCVEDARAAVRYMREHAKELGIDPQRIAAGGGSAGGHIAAGAALLPVTDAKNKPVTAKPDPLGKPNLLVLFNPPFGNYLDIKYFTKEAPPSIVFYGTKDWMVKFGPELVAHAKKAEFSVEVYTAEGQNHGFFRLQPWFDRTMYQADRFLAKHGYLKGDPTIKLPDGTHLQELK